MAFLLSIYRTLSQYCRCEGYEKYLEAIAERGWKYGL